MTSKPLPDKFICSALMFALDSIEDSIVILDKEWRYVFVNSIGWQILGKKPEDVLGKEVWEVLPHLDDTKFRRSAYWSMEKQEPITIEEYYPHSMKYFLTKFYPSEEYMVLHIIDTTELKRAQKINEQLMGNLQDAMDIYWSKENQVLRAKRNKKTTT